MDSIHSKLDQLQTDSRSLERSLDHTKALYANERTAHKHTEKNLKSAISEIDEVRREKVFIKF